MSAASTDRLIAKRRRVKIKRNRRVHPRIFTTPACPKDTVMLIDNGKVVGAITNVGPGVPWWRRLLNWLRFWR